jgi:hypothetical protein
MKLKQLIIAAVVLVALSATLYWSNHRKPTADASSTGVSSTVRLLALKQDDIAKLEVKKSHGDDVVLERAGEDRWKITSPTSLVADRDPVSTILYDLSPLDNASVIEEKPGDLKGFGLAEPTVSVTATGKDGKTQTILVGDDTPTGGAAYAMLAGDPKVYAVSTSTKTAFNKGLADLRDKRLVPVDFDKISSVEVTGPKLKMTFGSDNGQWSVRSPKDVRGDTSKLENIIEKLRIADMDPSTPEEERKKNASLFAAGSPIATIKATDAAGSQELQVRKNQKAYYAKTTAMEGTFKVADALGEAVDKSLDEFREKRLFDFASDNPEKIELHDGAKAIYLTRSGEDYWEDGKKLDALSVDGLLRSMRELTADKLVTTGFTTPELTLTATSRDGKLVEKIGFARVGKSYVAKRNDEAILYELDSKGIEDLRQSASGLKVAEAPPAPAKK